MVQHESDLIFRFCTSHRRLRTIAAMMRRSRVAAATLGLSFVVFSMWAWNSSPINLRDRLFPKHLAEVYPGALYRSGRIDSNLLRGVLEERKIDVIVDLTGDQGRIEQQEEIETAREMGVEHHIFSLRGDGTGDVREYVDAIEMIARSLDAKRTVLVHCSAGDRRTGGVVAAYQLLLRGEPIERAIGEIQRYSRTGIGESNIWPFLRTNLPEIARGLRSRGFDQAMRPEVARRVWDEGVPAGIIDG